MQWNFLPQISSACFSSNNFSIWFQFGIFLLNAIRLNLEWWRAFLKLSSDLCNRRSRLRHLPGRPTNRHFLNNLNGRNLTEAARNVADNPVLGRVRLPLGSIPQSSKPESCLISTNHQSNFIKEKPKPASISSRKPPRTTKPRKIQKQKIVPSEKEKDWSKRNLHSVFRKLLWGKWRQWWRTKDASKIWRRCWTKINPPNVNWNGFAGQDHCHQRQTWILDPSQMRRSDQRFFTSRAAPWYQSLLLNGLSRGLLMNLGFLVASGENCHNRRRCLKCAQDHPNNGCERSSIGRIKLLRAFCRGAYTENSPTCLLRGRDIERIKKQQSGFDERQRRITQR